MITVLNNEFLTKMVVIGVMKLEYGEVYEMCDPSLKIPVENGVYLTEIHPVEQKMQPKCQHDLSHYLPMVPLF